MTKDEQREIIESLEVGDVVELPTGSELVVRHVRVVEQTYSDDEYTFGLEKASGDVLEYREHHLENALASGAAIREVSR